MNKLLRNSNRMMPLSCTTALYAMVNVKKALLYVAICSRAHFFGSRILEHFGAIKPARLYVDKAVSTITSATIK